MSAAAFDTLKAARDLEAAGVERGQAEAIASVIRSEQDDLATKSDITAIKADIAGLRGIVSIQVVITLAILGAVLAMATRLYGG